MAVVNFTPVPRRDYRIGVPHAGTYTRVAQQRRRGLRRQQHGQRRAWSTAERSAVARPRPFAQSDRPTVGIPAPETEQVNLIRCRFFKLLDLAARSRS